MSFYTKPVLMLPGGIPFTDPRAPKKKFPGMEVASEDEQIAKIITWRKQNPNLYPPGEAHWFDKGSVLLELRQYQLNRLGNNRAYFTQGTVNNVPLPMKRKEPAKACPKCGAMDASAVLCKTCSSHRQTGWKCNNCATVRGM